MQGSPMPLQASRAAPMTPEQSVLLLKETACKQPVWALGPEGLLRAVLQQLQL